MTPPLPAHGPAEWFDAPNPAGVGDADERGLRFACTMCGSCCTGPSGYVLFTPAEGESMAAAVGVSAEEFRARYTRDTIMGRSLSEKPSPYGNDCVFLDRQKVPGKAVCGLYESRPMQCRTWPFWHGNLQTPRHWERAARTCPGINQGPATPPDVIRLTRDRLSI